MAEIAIPLALLGGMYILSNNDNKINPDNEESQNIESFIQNRNIIKNKKQQLPNNNPIEKNYPKQQVAVLKESPQYYPNPNTATDRYYKQSVYEQKADADQNLYKSLTGNTVNASDLKHNNMVPFFGSSVKQNMNISNESRLDNMIGNGSQHFKKQEQAPLFRPEENMHWAHGTPNQSNFIQSRINPSMSMANVKPFQEVRVGPGLNKENGVLGSGGFNSGMEARDKWISKTVDELRVKNNPKVTYGGVTLGAKSQVTNRGIMGNMEQHKPDTYFINTPERYFTTTGIEKAQTARASQILPTENRTTTTTEYYGAGADAEGNAAYVPGTYMKSKRNVLDPYNKHITNAHSANRNLANQGEYGVNGYKDSVLTNNRTLDAGHQPEYGIASLTRAVVAPLLDILRPSRKENAIGNLRPTGNAGNIANHAGYVYNPANRTKTTIREMTENHNGHQFVNNQHEAGGFGYIVNKHQGVQQERDTTSTYYIGNTGNGEGTSNIMVYDNAYNANIIDKEPLSRGRAPMGDSVKIFNGQDMMNIKVDKLESDRLNNREFVPQQMAYSSPAVEQKGLMTARSEYGQGVNCERNAPEILNAFNNNPYTKSLQSVA